MSERVERTGERRRACAARLTGANALHVNQWPEHGKTPVRFTPLKSDPLERGFSPHPRKVRPPEWLLESR
jgi:hypothetical protein